jgi:hypothetical protein
MTPRVILDGGADDPDSLGLASRFLFETLKINNIIKFQTSNS